MPECWQVCDVCIVAIWCILEQKLLLTAYRKLYMRNWFIPKWIPWPLFRGRLTITSCQPLRHIRYWISRKPSEVWFQRTTNRKWPMGVE